MLRLIGTLALGCAVLCAADHDWHSLFDGKTFANWQSAPSFVIEEGCLKSVAHPRVTEDLFSKENYGDFELEFDWKISPRGNSGVKYRIQDRIWLAPETPGQRFEDLVNLSLKNRRTERPAKGQEYVVGFEYQVIDNAGHADARRGPKYQTGSLYDLVPPKEDMTRPVGDFNHSRLVVKGTHSEHWLNGVKVVDTDLAEAAKGSDKRWGADSEVYRLLTTQARRDCPISLQNHDDPAWFRNIKIRRL